MSTHLTEPNVGSGPYNVEHDEADSFYYLTLHGTRTGKSYPLGKTAYRTARKLNDEHTGSAEAEPPVFLDDAPEAPQPPKAKPSKPKAPKEPKAAPVPPTGSKTFTFKADAVYEGTREEWLNDFVKAARPIFAERGFTIPEKVRVSVGFMKGGRKAIGQCWSDKASEDGTFEIFVIPTLDDSARIADVVTHELVHATVGIKDKGNNHGSDFRKVATGVGLEGKMTATTAGDGWREWAEPILAELGPIPHAKINPGLRGGKKKTYLLKGTCDACELVLRITAKHANGKRLICPDADCGGKLDIEGAEDLGEGDGE